MVADFTYDPGFAVDSAGAPARNAVGTLHEDIGGPSVQVYDQNSTPVAGLVSSDVAYVARFRADIKRGYAHFGDFWMPVTSDQVQDSLEQAEAAVATATAALAIAQEALEAANGAASPETAATRDYVDDEVAEVRSDLASATSGLVQAQSAVSFRIWRRTAAQGLPTDAEGPVSSDVCFVEA